MSASTFLQGLAKEDRAVFESRLVVQDYARGATVIHYLDQDRDVYFVLQGRIRVTLYSLSGKEVDYRDIGIGGIVGEMAAIDGGTRSASVVAIEPARLGRIPVKVLHELVETQPRIAWALLRHLTGQVRRLTERVFEFSTLAVHDRLIRELLRLAEASGAEGGRAEIQPAPTHFDLAHRISSHREVVSREMSRLSKAGLLKKRGPVLVIHDLDGLRSRLEEVD